MSTHPSAATLASSCLLRPSLAFLVLVRPFVGPFVVVAGLPQGPEARSHDLPLIRGPLCRLRYAPAAIQKTEMDVGVWRSLGDAQIAEAGRSLKCEKVDHSRLKRSLTKSKPIFGYYQRQMGGLRGTTHTYGPRTRVGGARGPSKTAQNHILGQTQEHFFQEKVPRKFAEKIFCQEMGPARCCAHHP